MDAYDIRVFERITELVSLLSQPGDGISIREIAQITESSPEQTRTDLKLLHTYGLSIFPDDIADRLSRYEGRYDDVPFLLSAEIPGDAGLAGGLLFLTPMERSLFRRKGMGTLKIKDTPTSVPADVLRRADVIAKTISDRRTVQFRYRRAGEQKSEQIETAPVFLYFNATDDLYYCISFKDDETVSFRLDRILFDVHPGKLAAAPIDPDDSRLQRLQYIWGAAFSSEEEPVRVKVRIEAGTANLLNKIRSDTAGRTHAKLYQDGDYYIYEDDIIGMNSFRSWLLSFGYSVKVLEPVSLAEEVLLSSEKRLGNYENGNTFTG